ncbi:MAG TPA: NAD-dependent epimerase/dehydratase family protein [Pirellulales bacterium]|jgi:dihydroflavonol-4-reductase
MNRVDGATLVTGATGLLGNNVVRLLLSRGESVRVLARDAEDPALAGLSVERFAGDVRDAGSVRAACEGVAAVIHAAAHVRMGWRQPELYESINVDGTRNVAAACRAGGARMVHVSSTDVFGRCSLRHATDEETPPGPGPKTPYALTKRAAESVVLQECDQGLSAVIINPGFMLGPWDWKPSSGRIVLAVGRGTAIVAPKGWLSLCDARDVAAGALAARDCGAIARRYILAGETLRFIDAFRLIAEVCHTIRPLMQARRVIASIGGYSGDLWGWISGTEPDVNSAAVAMARLPKNYNSARAERELGYRRRPVHETIADAWNWFGEHGYR